MKTNVLQKKMSYTALLVLLLSVVGMTEVVAQGNVPIGALNGVFSVSENNQVYFSQGNLQYQASTNTWRFAENQWDFVGEDNVNASATYDGWIDLFSWGTSGYEHGSVCYQPWTTGDQFDHAAYAHNEYDLCDENGQADWGYNAISNGGNEEMQWRTCKSSEWQYLLEIRQTTSGIRYAKAIVDGINGLILLPDNWNSSVYALNNPNETDASYSVNTVSVEDWANMLEANGAVFLPAAAETNNGYGERGAYWSASTATPWLKTLFDFTSDYLHSASSFYPDIRYSVRLIRSANDFSTISSTINCVGSGTVTGMGTCQNGQACTLTATPSSGYTFLYWKEYGKVVSTANPYSFAVGFDRELEACFNGTTTYPLIYSFDDDEHVATVIAHWEGQHASGDLVIPENVVYLGETYSVTAIGGCAFQSCIGLTSIEIPNSVTTIAFGALSDCFSLMEIDLPDHLVSIGSEAFTGTSIATMVIPESVTSLGSQVFYGCQNLTSVTLPSGITSLGYGLFQYCRALPKITLPSSIESIESDAFLSCHNLRSVVLFSETPPVLESSAFDEVDKTQVTVYVPCGSLEAYENAENWNEFTNFAEMCQGVITVTANPADCGAVTGGGSYEGGETCTVTAYPNEGYGFMNWTENDEVVSTEACYSFIVAGNRDLVANFHEETGMDERIGHIQVFPNPVERGQSIRVGFPNTEKEIRVEIINALGAKLLPSMSIQTSTGIKTPSVPGVYMLRISVEGEGTYCGKLVVK